MNWTELDPESNESVARVDRDIYRERERARLSTDKLLLDLYYCDFKSYLPTPSKYVGSIERRRSTN